MLLLARKVLTTQQIIDLVETRQNLEDRETNEVEKDFINIQSLVKDKNIPYQANYPSFVVPPDMSKINAAARPTTEPKQPVYVYPEPDINKEIAFDVLITSSNGAKLRDWTVYQLKARDGNVVGIPIPSDPNGPPPQLCHVMHSTYYMMYEAIRRLSPPPLDVENINDSQIEWIKAFFADTSNDKSSLIYRTLDKASKDEAKKNVLLLLSRFSVYQMLDSKNKEESHKWFGDLVLLSDQPQTKPLIPCFLDVLRAYEDGLTGVNSKKFTEDLYYKRNIWAPAPAPSVASTTNPQGSQYLPSEGRRRDTSEKRWSTFFTELFDKHF